MKKRPKICDYMGPPGGKTPLGTKIPPLTEKELKIGKSLEKKARKLLKKYKLLDQINKNIETYNEDSNIFTTDHIQYISNWNNSYIRNIDSYRMNLQEEYQKNIKNQINNLTTAKDELMRYYTIEYLKCSHTIKDLFFDIFALVLILMIFSLMFLISLPIINLVINNLFLYMNICMTVMWISLKIIFIMIIVFILVANMIGNILYK